MNPLAADWLETPSAEESPANELPPWTGAAEFCAAPCPRPPEIIHGILHGGCKMAFGGPSKAHKTWILADLAVSVSNGINWLGLPTTKGTVLYVNFELPAFAFHERLLKIAEARRVELSNNLLVWNLRGKSASCGAVLQRVAAHFNGGDLALLITDPMYKLIGPAMRENDPGDMSAVMDSLESVCGATGCAAAFGSHFAKGDASAKNAIDRISGSGVFGRDPDAILTCTPHQEPGAFTVDANLRTMPPQTPFVIRWECPIMRRDNALNPAALKRPQGRPTKPKPTDDEVVRLFSDAQDKPRAALMTAVQLRGAFRARGWDDATAPELRDKLDGEGRLKVWHGPCNQKLCGLPSVVDAFAKSTKKSKRR